MKNHEHMGVMGVPWVFNFLINSWNSTSYPEDMAAQAKLAQHLRRLKFHIKE